MSDQQQEDSKTRVVQGLQRSFFGDRFVGATFASVSLPEELATRIAKFVQEPKKFLVILGPPGVGKTYICSCFLEHFPEGGAWTVRAYSERQLFERLRAGISANHGDYMDHLHHLIDDDLIMLDDIGSSGHNAWREEVLMEALDYRYKDGKKTVITSNLSQSDFKNIYGERITSRLFATENSIVSLFGMPDLRQQGM